MPDRSPLIRVTAEYSSPLAGEEGARRAAAGRRGGGRDLLLLAKQMRREQIGDYIVDFVCFRRKLIVEADGSQHAENTRDIDRDDWLASQGFRILRFWNNDILADTNTVAQAILSALEPPLPTPSPARGEGL